MRYTNSLHYNDGALKGQQWPRLAPIFILILILVLIDARELSDIANRNQNINTLDLVNTTQLHDLSANKQSMMYTSNITQGSECVSLKGVHRHSASV